MKRILMGLVIVLSIIIVEGNVTQAVHAQSINVDDIQETNYAKGALVDEREEIEKVLIDTEDELAIVKEELLEKAGYKGARSTWPPSADVSEKLYFPSIIGDQGNVASCGSFATTYYQFTCEANQLNGITSNSNATIYSPRYVYNYINFGISNRTTIPDNYKVLETFGCLTMDEFPYYTVVEGTESEMEIDCTEWSTNTQAKREALNVRLDTYRAINLAGTEAATLITSAEDADLELIKIFLYAGKVLTATSEFEWDAKTGYGDDSDKCVAYRCKEGEPHAVTIVGYDDNVECDVNGNGTIETFERGAFKIVNSWGASFNGSGVFSRDGFVWILYDALNGVSADTNNNWESACTGTRTTAFHNDNTLYAMYVENKEVNFVGELDISDNSKFSMLISGYWAQDGQPFGNNIVKVLQLKNATTIGGDTIDYNGEIIFDYSKTPTKDFISGYKWGIVYNSYNVNRASYTITDNLGNIIEDYGTISSVTSPIGRSISLQKGDLDYSGKVSADDSNAVLKYVTKQIDFSNVQKCLADVDEDGDIDATDANKILNIVVGIE